MTPGSAPVAVRSPLAIVLIILLMSLGATFATWQMANSQLLDYQQKEFSFQAQEATSRLERRMGTYEQAARGTQAHLLGSMDVSQQDFQWFVAALQLREKFPGIQGVALSRLVSAAELDAHERAMRTQFPDYAIRPAGARLHYSTITHIAPHAGLNLRAIGFDMMTEPIRRAAMERARDSGQAAASGKVRLMQENGVDEQPGLVMYLPVYRRNVPVQSVEERRANILGWVGAPFRMRDLMAGLGGERASEISIAIYDGGTAAPANQLFASPAPAGAPHVPRFATETGIVVAGRAWTLVLHSTPAFERRFASTGPDIVALVGTILSLVLTALVWTLATGRGRALALAHGMTRQLADSEYRWKYALEGAGDGVWDWNRLTGEMVFSRRWKAMLGYQEQDIADDMAELGRLLHPDDAPGVERLLAAYLDSTDAVYEAQFRLRCKDDSWRWILARGMAVTRDGAGKPVRTIGTHTDITRSKQDEATLRVANASLAAEKHRVQVLLDHSHDAFIALRHDGRVSDWNPKAEQLFGWSAKEAIGADFATLIIPPEARAGHNAGFRRFVDAGDGKLKRNVVEVSALHRSGYLIPIELAIAGIPVEQGMAVSAFIRDLSERKQAQKQEEERSRALAEARKALQHAQKLESVGKLTGGIAHDFNNVLHVIGGNVQLLQMLVGSDERIVKRLASMQSAVDRGAKLSSQLLAFARRQPLQPAVVDLRQSLRSMEDLLQRAVGEGVTIKTMFAEDLWNTLVDPGQLENVIMNLVINARDAMEGGGTVTIALDNARLSAATAPALSGLIEGDYLHLSVSDTGAGMSSEVAALAFEPFFTTKPVGQGTGLGLSMAYGFVKQSDGHITLDSAAGMGTSVHIYLPRSDQACSVVPAAPVELAVGGTESILVVEDDPDVRLTAVSTLTDLGYRVLDAHDGAAALLVLGSAAPIDLLFTDVVMPGPVSSTELAAQARARYPGMAVLFTSGYTRDALTTGGRLDAGVQLLGKPYRREQLAARVREVLRQR
ncbi:MAG: CHASE domain-containing protein [Pseudomonadota bacterium]